MRRIQTFVPDEVAVILNQERGLASMSAYVGNLLVAYAAGIADGHEIGESNIGKVESI